MTANNSELSVSTSVTTGPDEVRHVVERLLRAVEAVDPIGYFDATYHPKITIHECPSLPYGGDYHGYEGVLAHAHAFLTTWTPHQTDEERSLNGEIVTAPDHAYVRWTLKVAGRGFAFVSHYRFDSGLIIESWMYPFDTPALLALWEQLESTPSQ